MWEFFQDVSTFVLGILSILGSWSSMVVAYILTYAFIAIDAGRLWAYNNPEFVYGFGAAIIACGVVALILRSLWRRWLRDLIRPWYWRLIQRPMHRVLGPVRRLHRRWSERNKEKRMAKYKESMLADIVGDALLEANVLGVISDQEYRRYMSKAAKALGLKDLARVSHHKLAIAHRVKNNDTSKAGPKQETPAWGGKPGEDNVPKFKELGSGFLSRHLKRTA